MEKLTCRLENTTENKPYIEDYIRHIKFMICWKIEENETFRKHLDRLIMYFNDRKDKNKSDAVKKFRDFQTKENLNVILSKFGDIKAGDYNNFTIQ